MDNIKDILQDVIKQLTADQPKEQAKIEAVWRQSLGPKEIKHTRLIGVKEGKLSVCVDSSAWLYQLNIQRPKILNKMQGAVPGIKSIHFRIGRIK